jgi:hypothetical protein
VMTFASPLIIADFVVSFASVISAGYGDLVLWHILRNFVEFSINFYGTSKLVL